MIKKLAEQYQENYVQQAVKEISFPSDARLVIAIPSFNEPDLFKTLDSLNECNEVGKSIQVIILINDCLDTSQKIKDKHELLFQELIHSKEEYKYSLHPIYCDNLNPKKHGAGNARKLGMDIAALALAKNNQDGIIICLDADCTVSHNYISELIIADQSEANLFTISYTHQNRWSEVDKNLQDGIYLYELHLYYYVHALRLIDYPFALHTVGSSMGVRCSSYFLNGGMNTKKAGEDFYFLNKLIPLLKHYRVDKAKVYPSARTSDRVPFGTGKAQSEWLDQKELTTYKLEHFKILADLISHFKNKQLTRIAFFEKCATSFLEGEMKNCLPSKIGDERDRIFKISKDNHSFQKNCYFYWNPFRVMKVLNALRALYGTSPVLSESKKLIEATFPEYLNSELLESMHKLEDKFTPSPYFCLNQWIRNNEK